MERYSENPLVTVIVPVYKVEKYLRRCIESIIGQTYQKLEIILVDDGSPDRCGDICEEYAGKDDRIRVFHQKNAGQAAARNLGMDVAQGEWFSFIDSDDFICDHFIERMVGYGITYHADIVSCRWKTGTEETIASPVTSPAEVKVRTYSGRECYLKYFTSKKLPALENMCIKLFQAELFRDLRLIPGRTFEDMAIMHYLFDRAEKVVFADEQLYYYYQSPGSTVRGKFTIRKLNAIKNYEERLDYFYKIGGKALWGRALQQYQDTLFRYYYLLERDCRNSKKVGKAQKILLGKIRRNDLQLRQQSNISLCVKVFSWIGTFCPYFAGCVSEKLIDIRFWRK